MPSSQSRGGLQGGGVPSLHRPVRGSRCPTPVLSSSGGLVRQPDISQVTARTVIINFMICYLPLSAFFVGRVFFVWSSRCDILSQFELNRHLITAVGFRLTLIGAPQFLTIPGDSGVAQALHGCT